ncbi:MAG: hypothetical protein QXO24_03040, partial [Candidatus Micrarchaeaceae archaeon]
TTTQATTTMVCPPMLYTQPTGGEATRRHERTSKSYDAEHWRLGFKITCFLYRTTLETMRLAMAFFKVRLIGWIEEL